MKTKSCKDEKKPDSKGGEKKGESKLPPGFKPFPKKKK